MTDTTAPVFDAEGWCHQMEDAPRDKMLDLWDRGARVVDCAYALPHFESEERWCFRRDFAWHYLEEPTAWRYPPAPPVGE